MKTKYIIKDIHKIMTIPDQGVAHDRPHPFLRPFINQYTFRHIDIPPGSDMEKVMPLRLVNSIDFFIGDTFDTIDCFSSEFMPFNRCTIRGPRTGKKYLIRLRGQFISFTVKFHATGLYQLLGVPMDNFRDKAIPGCDIGILAFEEMTERLLYANNIRTCIAIVEPYLFRLALLRGFSVSNATANAAGQLLQQKGRTSITSLAMSNNLSVRQLQRNFIKEVGVSPKTYSRMIRFLHVLQDKIAAPDQKWISLAYSADYFDQRHLLREFREFLDTTPSAFVPTDFAF